MSYVANSGASATGANFVAVANASIAPRAAGEAISSSVAARSIETRASLVFDSRANAVYGHAAHAKASRTPSRVPRGPARSRRPSRNRSAIVARSKKIEAAWAAGRSSQSPLQAKTCSKGWYT